MIVSMLYQLKRRKLKIPTVTVNADTSRVDRAIKAVQERIREINGSIELSESKIMKIYHVGTQLLNYTLSMMKKAQSIQGLQIAQQIITTQISVSTLQTQATAAFATGNIWQGIMFEGLAAQQQLTLAISFAEQRNADMLQNQINNINEMRDQYR